MPSTEKPSLGNQGKFPGGGDIPYFPPSFPCPPSSSLLPKARIFFYYNFLYPQSVFIKEQSIQITKKELLLPPPEAKEMITACRIESQRNSFSTHSRPAIDAPPHWHTHTACSTYTHTHNHSHTCSHQASTLIGPHSGTHTNTHTFTHSRKYNQGLLRLQEDQETA